MRMLPNAMGDSITSKRMGSAVDERVTAILQRKHPWIRSRWLNMALATPLNDSPFALPAG
jgi:hypothetical protein